MIAEEFIERFHLREGFKCRKSAAAQTYDCCERLLKRQHILASFLDDFLRRNSYRFYGFSILTATLYNFPRKNIP